jgi:hypothetical protein
VTTTVQKAPNIRVESLRVVGQDDVRLTVKLMTPRVVVIWTMTLTYVVEQHPLVEAVTTLVGTN